MLPTNKLIINYLITNLQHLNHSVLHNYLQSLQIPAEEALYLVPRLDYRLYQKEFKITWSEVALKRIGTYFIYIY